VARVEDSGELTLNDAKFGLSWRLEIPPRDVFLYKVGYYDGLATNEAFRSKIVLCDAAAPEGDPGTLFTKLDEFFPLAQAEESMELDAMPTPTIANHVGVTVLALSKEGTPLLFRQSKRMAIGSGSIVASASGSVDYSDIARSRSGGNLLELIKFSMARELCEEAENRLENWGPEWAVPWLARTGEERLLAIKNNVCVTGFFRWVNRCGKPEFFGVTRLSESKHDIVPNGYEVRAFRGSVAPDIRRMSDFFHLRQWLRDTLISAQTNVGLSSYVGLLRLCEMAQTTNETSAIQKVKQTLQLPS
jgi:hypothetical protein